MNAHANPSLRNSADLADVEKVARSTQPQPITQVLAEFASGVRAEDIPPSVRFRALHHMLDAAGIAVAASRYDHSHRVLNAM
ncbi:MAG: hypothetical protein ACK47M_23160, partial [Caldilinea sp.]